MELQVLLESYDEEKDIITRKGNAKSSATRRTKAWQRIADRIKAALHCDKTALCQVLERVGHKELSFSVREWNLMKELLDVLKPFGEATDLTQGENVVTISSVLPSVLSLNHHLEKLKSEVTFLRGLVRALQASLKTRFLGIFINVEMDSNQDGISAPFSDPVYLKAAALDPVFSLQWVEPHVMVTPDVKEQVAEKV
ncbi:unnamed protein product [Boreogadus saida]